jgi:hypothetical protein
MQVEQCGCTQEVARHDEQLKTADSGMIGMSKLRAIVGVVRAELVRLVVRGGKVETLAI